MTISRLPRELVQRIIEGADGLGERGRAVGRLILEQPEEAAMLTAARIAERLDVSESTVIRFVQAIGYRGYPELRRELQGHVRQYLSQIERVEATTVERTSDMMARRSLALDIDNLRQTLDGLDGLDGLDPMQMDRAVELICQARRVYVLGVRSVFGIADTFTFHLRHAIAQPILLDPARGNRATFLSASAFLAIRAWSRAR